jgi:hypothetical protein
MWSTAGSGCSWRAGIGEGRGSPMEFSFTRYLLSKQSVDDRALNQHVLEALRGHMPTGPVRIIEIGAGIGTMPRRLIRWDVIRQGEYVMVDQMAENIEFASEWIPQWAAQAGLSVEPTGEGEMRLTGQGRDVRIRLVRADVSDFIEAAPEPADILIAHAVLDLLPMPSSMAKILSLTKGLAWMTINFDGLTVLEPAIDAALDAELERLYHASMDARVSGGDSRSGRHLFTYIREAGAEILAAGGSDWVVHPTGKKYPEDEAYFLHGILRFFDDSLGGKPDVDQEALTAWLDQRRAQIQRGELVYVAHQVDFLVRV